MSMYNRRFLDRIDKPGFECTVHYGKDASGRMSFTVETGKDTEHFRDLTVEEQRKALAWLSYNLIPSEKPLSGHTSYGMKDYLESRTNIYMTNNQFKEAMLLSGFLPVEADEKNWRFYVLRSSPMFVKQTDGRYGLPMLGDPMDYKEHGGETR